MSETQQKLAEIAQEMTDGGDANDAESGGDSSDADFVGNETADGYLTFADARAVAGAVNEALGLEIPNLNVYELTREDIPRVLQQASEEGWEANEAYWGVLACMKSFLGNRQANENDFGIGLEKDGSEVVGHYDGGYAAMFGATLPSIETETMGEEEAAALREYGVDVDALGFRPDGRPVFPILNGERLPAFVGDFEELEAAVEQLEAFPEEPSLGNVAESDVPIDPSGFTIPELREELAGIEDNDALEAILEAEQEGKDRKGAAEAIEDRMDLAPETNDDGDADDEALQVLVDAGFSEEQAKILLAE
jgi:hypothetical protein